MLYYTTEVSNINNNLKYLGRMPNNLLLVLYVSNLVLLRIRFRLAYLCLSFRQSFAYSVNNPGSCMCEDAYVYYFSHFRWIRSASYFPMFPHLSLLTEFSKASFSLSNSVYLSIYLFFYVPLSIYLYAFFQQPVYTYICIYFVLKLRLISTSAAL